MKVLITGAQGMLGSDLVSVLTRKHELYPCTRTELDITDRDTTISSTRNLKPDLVINCSAYTNVDLAEKERDKAFSVNGLGVQNIALACSKLNIPICHISTDYVFDGTKTTPYTPFDKTSPINSYGESKLAGEKYIQWITNRFYIVRTSWLYGKNKDNFAATMLKLSKEREEIRVVDDQIGSPTWTVSLSEGIESLIQTEAFGIYNITDDSGNGISWYDFAREIILLAGGSARVVPIPTSEYPTPARRPANSTLDLSLNESVFGFSAPFWKQSLKEYLV